ncbi:Replicase family protein [compost metagenome]
MGSQLFVAPPRTAKAAYGFFQAGTALNRVLQEAPYLARCSDNKTAARVRPREYAISYPYIQVNRPGMVSWLIFDLDHANALIWDEAGLPPPNLVVRNRGNGHAHLYYAIVPVCTSVNGRSAPISYMKAVYEAFALQLNADLEYGGGPVAKTPGHPWWETSEYHDHVYDLGELAEAVELPQAKPWNKGPRLDAAAHSRHCILFERMRYYAYSIVNEARANGTFQQFVHRLEAFAFNNNDFKAYGFAESLPLSSLKATVKSISRWTWDRYRGGARCHRGVMGLPAEMPLHEKQRLAALRTHGIRHKSTESKVRAACRRLIAAGEQLRVSAIARMANISRQTTAAYKHVMREVQNAAIEGSAAIAKLGVKYGVHQIPAALSACLSALKGVVGITVGDCMASKNKQEKRARRAKQKAKASRIARSGPVDRNQDVVDEVELSEELVQRFEQAEHNGGRIAMLAELIDAAGRIESDDPCAVQQVMLALYYRPRLESGELSEQWWAEPDFLADYAVATAQVGREDLIEVRNRELEAL